MGELKDEFQEATDAAGKGDWGTVYDIMAAHKGDSYELGTYIHTYTHTNKYNIHEFILFTGHTCTFNNTTSLKCMYTCMYVCMHTYIHTYTHTYIHTYIHSYILHISILGFCSGILIGTVLPALILFRSPALAFGLFRLVISNIIDNIFLLCLEIILTYVCMHVCMYVM
jgi:hypothetical protein